MTRENNPLVLCLFGILPVVWLGLLLAPAAHGGLPEIVARFPAVMNDPFHIELCGDSLKTVLVLLCAYGLAVGVILSSRRNYRRGEEHGSAKWGSARTVNRKYRAAEPEENKIFTQNVRMGLDGRKHRRNLNTVVVGGSGAGKTRFYAKPNLCQANTSFTVLDPKGELLRSTGHLLRQKGYEVRVLDLLNMEKSHCYNPFVYLRDDNDVQRLVTNLFKSTTPKGHTGALTMFITLSPTSSFTLSTRNWIRIANTTIIVTALLKLAIFCVSFHIFLYLKKGFESPFKHLCCIQKGALFQTPHLQEKPRQHFPECLSTIQFFYSYTH